MARSKICTDDSLDVFGTNPGGFSSLFRRVLTLSIDDSPTITVRIHLLSFLISAFQSLDNGIVRKECAPLVSISIWHHLASEESREAKFEQHGQLRKVWRAALKRYDAAEESIKTRLKFDRSWLFSMVLDFVKRLYFMDEDSKGIRITHLWLLYKTKLLIGNVLYCERFLELITDLQSQLPTRRYFNTLVHDINLISLIKLSPLFNDEENALLRDLFNLFRHFTEFSIDDNTAIQYSREQSYEIHCAKLARLQRSSLKYFKSKLTILALSNYGAIDSREELENHLSKLSELELEEMCTVLGFRTKYPLTTIPVNRHLHLEVLVQAHERHKTFQEVLRDLRVLPTEVWYFILKLPA